MMILAIFLSMLMFPVLAKSQSNPQVLLVLRDGGGTIYRYYANQRS